MSGDDHISNQIKIPTGLIEKIRLHGEKTYPEECCGVLIGNYYDNIPSVSEIRQMKNTNEGSKKTRYNIDPLELIKLEDELDEKDLVMLGIYHSHPNHPPRPSETDFNLAWPNLSYIVVSVKDGKSEQITSWRLQTNGTEKIKFIEEEIKEEK